MDGLAEIAAAGLAAYFLFKSFSAYSRWISSPLWSLPGPRRPTWLFGEFLTIQKEPFLEPQRRWIKEAGGYDSPVIHHTLPVGTHALMILDADIVRKVLFANYGKNPLFAKSLDSLIPLTGNGLLTLEGEDWQRHRRIIHPTFQPKSIKASLDDDVPKLVNEMISYWKKAEGKEIDVIAHFSHLMLDVIGKVAFSHEFRALESVGKWASGHIEEDEALPPITDRLIVGITTMIKNTPRLILVFMLKLSALDFATKKTAKSIDTAVDEIIHAARVKLEKKHTPNITNIDEKKAGNQGKTHLPRSLLQTLFDAEDTDPSTHARKFLNNLELREEVKTFIFAGHETTSTWCYWAIFALCQYPDVQEKVYNDVRDHITCSGKNNFSITIESVEKMTYLDAFLKETLRMYPPVAVLIREIVKDETINGIDIPAKTQIVIPSHILHRHPKYWDDPETFKPERWLKGEYPMKHKQAYLPFSDGYRNCVGYQFATIEAKLVVAHLISQFHFRLAPSVRDETFTLEHGMNLTLRLAQNLKVCVRSRAE